MCREFSTLPYPGGLFHQDTRHIAKMEKVLDAENYVRSLEDGTLPAKAQAEEKLRKRLGI